MTSSGQLTVGDRARYAAACAAAGEPNGVMDRATAAFSAMAQSSDPQAYLDGVHVAFDDAGRSDDALAAMVLRALFRGNEIEMLMHMRAEWRGQRAPIRPRPSRSAWSEVDPEGER